MTLTNESAIRKVVCMNILLIILVPLYYFQISIFTASTIVTLLSFIIIFFLKRKITITKGIKWYFVFVVWSAISYIWSIDRGTWTGRMRDIITFLLLMVNIAQYCCYDNDINKVHKRCSQLITWYIICGTAFTAMCYFFEGRSLLVWPRLGTVATAKIGGLTWFTVVLVSLCFFVEHRMMENYDNKRTLYMILFAFLYISCILTGVRKALFLPLIFLYMYILLKYKSNMVKLIGFSIFAVLILILAYYVMMKYSPSMLYRVEVLLKSLTGSASDMSLNIRNNLKHLAWQCFLENPLTGVGIGQFRTYSMWHGGDFLYAHDNIAELLADLGIFGFILFYVNYFRVLIHQITKNEQLLIFSITFIISFFIFDFNQISYYYDCVGVVMGIYLCFYENAIKGEIEYNSL